MTYIIMVQYAGCTYLCSGLIFGLFR